MNWNYPFVSGDIVHFTGSNQTAVDTVTNQSVGGLYFDPGASPFTISNNTITLAGQGDIENNSTNTQTINSTITLEAPAVFAAYSGNLAFGGQISFGTNSPSLAITGSNSTSIAGNIVGQGMLTKSGTGNLTLSGSNSFTGNTTINTGTLLVNGSLGASSSVSVAAGATLGGSGTIGGSVVRELGPLITAIILAGRSGSAFAAEIGTMKVTQELDALRTFGIDPVRFLVIPRLIATTVVTPMLAIWASVLGVAGGYMILAPEGFTLAQYTDEVRQALTVGGFVQGLVKAAVFAILVASIGCLSGLRTGQGPGAVGLSTTRAVVAGIVAIIIADSILGTFFYALDI